MMLPKYIWMFSAKLTSEPWGSSRCWLDFVLASPQAHPQNLQFIMERPYRLLDGGDSEDREKDGECPCDAHFHTRGNGGSEKTGPWDSGMRERGPVPCLPDAGASAVKSCSSRSCGASSLSTQPRRITGWSPDLSEEDTITEATCPVGLRWP